MNTHRVTLGMISHAHAAAKGECSARTVLERYYEEVRRHNLEPEALIFYGLLMEPSETKYQHVFRLAICQMMANKRLSADQVRLRDDKSTGGMLKCVAHLRHLLAAAVVNGDVRRMLDEIFEVPRDLPARLTELVEELAHSFGRQGQACPAA